MPGKLTATNASRLTLIVRLIAGPVFLSEGIQKWLFPAERGAGRFEKIGLPSPELLGYFVGTVEIICGALVILGLLTRLAALPLFVIMLVALATTKIPMGLSEGFWEMAHAMRTDWSMTLSTFYLLITGAGAWSIDRQLSRKPV